MENTATKTIRIVARSKRDRVEYELHNGRPFCCTVAMIFFVSFNAFFVLSKHDFVVFIRQGRTLVAN